jgi:hypothetical protein
VPLSGAVRDIVVRAAAALGAVVRWVACEWHYRHMLLLPPPPPPRPLPLLLLLRG